MKKSILFVISISALCIYQSCKTTQADLPCTYSMSLVIPTNLNPIDWENFNDVKTVYYNYMKYCSDKTPLNKKNIKVYGWLPWGYDLVYLSHDSTAVVEWNEYDRSAIIPIRNVPSLEYTYREYQENVDSMFQKRPKTKCYVEGKILYSAMGGDDSDCCNVIIYAERFYYEDGENYVEVEVIPEMPIDSIY